MPHHNPVTVGHQVDKLDAIDSASRIGKHAFRMWHMACPACGGGKWHAVFVGSKLMSWVSSFDGAVMEATERGGRVDTCPTCNGRNHVAAIVIVEET